MWKEFKPTILFLLRFGLTYGLLSVIYSFYISGFESANPPVPDGFTSFVAQQSSAVIRWFDASSTTYNASGSSSVIVTLNEQPAVDVFQGCNGASMIILFIAFVAAFGGKWKQMVWFIPAGVVFIHLSNLARISALAYIAIHDPRSMYFFHKYGFTIVIYAAVFLLWVIWVGRFQQHRFKRKSQDTTVTA